MHRQLAPALRADYDMRAVGYVENARVELIDRFAQHVAQMAATARRLAGEHLGEANQILLGSCRLTRAKLDSRAVVWGAPSSPRGR